MRVLLKQLRQCTLRDLPDVQETNFTRKKHVQVQASGEDSVISSKDHEAAPGGELVHQFRNGP